MGLFDGLERDLKAVAAVTPAGGTGADAQSGVAEPQRCKQCGIPVGLQLVDDVWLCENCRPDEDGQEAQAVAPAHGNELDSPQMVELRAQQTAEYWAPKLDESYGRTVEAIIAHGLDLIAAKKHLEFNGQFLRLFRTHKNPVANPRPYSEDTAEKYMAVAERFAHSAFLRNLPPSHTSLYALRKVSDERIKAAIAAEQLHADSTGKAIAALKQSTTIMPVTTKTTAEPREMERLANSYFEPDWAKAMYAAERETQSVEAKKLLLQVVDGWLAELRLRRQGVDPCAEQHQKLVRKFERVPETDQIALVHLVEHVKTQLELNLGGEQT